MKEIRNISLCIFTYKWAKRSKGKDAPSHTKRYLVENPLKVQRVKHFTSDRSSYRDRIEGFGISACEFFRSDK